MSAAPPLNLAKQLPGESAVQTEATAGAGRMLHAAMGQLMQGISPISLALAWSDWALHLAEAPAKWARLGAKAWDKDIRWLDYALNASTGAQIAPCITPLPQDRRFRHPAWQRWPYNAIHQAFLLNQQWWHNATTDVEGVSPHHEELVSFLARQMLDLASPLNFAATNPELSATILREGGANLLRGALNLAEDWQRAASGAPPAGAENFRPGYEVAATPGHVVFRNSLMELIQYSPTTATVHAEPMLIVPAWIMKYYILDLSRENSLVRYLVGRGHTVFMVSWHNRGQDERGPGMDAYLEDGVMAAIDAVTRAVPGQRINTAGYCLGGTLLAIAAAALACQGRTLVNSMTMLAAQVDFTEAGGELMLFIDESQVAYLEDLMWQQGYLDNSQLAGAFRLLRSHDLIWSLAVSQYLLGERAPMTDLMAWNADTTRLPYRMHSDYLRELFLDKDLFSGRYKVDQRPIALSDIQVPTFAVATMADHVSPWRSVHKIHLLANADVSFVLTSGGHNAGIVSEPGHCGRHYYSSFTPKGAGHADPDLWLKTAERHDGSWWVKWAGWLEQVSKGPRTDAPTLAASLGAAPGRYVLER